MAYNAITRGHKQGTPFLNWLGGLGSLCSATPQLLETKGTPAGRSGAKERPDPEVEVRSVQRPSQPRPRPAHRNPAERMTCRCRSWQGAAGRQAHAQSADAANPLSEIWRSFSLIRTPFVRVFSDAELGGKRRV